MEIGLKAQKTMSLNRSKSKSPALNELASNFYTETNMAIKTNMVKHCLKKELQDNMLEKDPEEFA